MLSLAKHQVVHPNNSIVLAMLAVPCSFVYLTTSISMTTPRLWRESGCCLTLGMWIRRSSVGRTYRSERFKVIDRPRDCWAARSLNLVGGRASIRTNGRRIGSMTRATIRRPIAHCWRKCARYGETLAILMRLRQSCRSYGTHRRWVATIPARAAVGRNSRSAAGREDRLMG